MRGSELSTFKKRLAAMSVTLLAAGAVMTGTASAAPANNDNCDPAVYEFCVFADAYYGGASYKVQWGQSDEWIQLPDSVHGKVSSLVNNTGYTWNTAWDSGSIIFRVPTYLHVPSLGSDDNKIKVIGIVK